MKNIYNNKNIYENDVKNIYKWNLMHNILNPSKHVKTTDFIINIY